jgi:2,3-bisphosphoglycerate-dependent phosphoglycerate mutase
MQFYFIRHAQSQNNALWDRTGASKGRNEDPELTDVGLKQAQVLGEFLANDRKLEMVPNNGAASQNVEGFQFTHLYCSLMTRAVQTGTAVSNAMGIPLTGWLDLHETGGIYLEENIPDDNGMFVTATQQLRGLPGKTRTEFAARFPRLILPESVTDEGWWNRPYETDEERIPRAQRVLAELLDRHGKTDDRVAIVSHGGFFNTLMTVMLGFDRFQNFWFAVNNASISRFDFGDDHFGIIYINRLDYMPPELIS